MDNLNNSSTDARRRVFEVVENCLITLCGSADIEVSREALTLREKLDSIFKTAPQSQQPAPAAA